MPDQPDPTSRPERDGPVTDEPVAPGPVADEAVAPGPVADEADEKQWWDDPRMPWKGKPGRSDIAVWLGICAIGIYSLVLIPIRPLLIGTIPLLLVALSGSRSGLVTIGALSAVGRADWWWLGLVLGSVSLIKFDPVFFAAGRLWGGGVLDMVGARSRRSRRNAERAERLARRFGVLAVVLSYVVPVPSLVIFATLGAARMRWVTFLAADLLSAFTINSLWLYLGHRLGQPAVDVVDKIAKYSGYISLALLAVILVGAVLNARRRAAHSAEATATEENSTQENSTGVDRPTDD